MYHFKMCILLILLVSTYSLVNGFGLHGFTFKGLDGPQTVDTRAKDVQEKWLSQRLDHFNLRESSNWSMVRIYFILK